MNIDVKVIPHARKNFLKEENGIWKIYLTAPALAGRANEALLEFLAGQLRVKKSQIQIIKGLKSRKKVIKILS